MCHPSFVELCMQLSCHTSHDISFLIPLTMIHIYVTHMVVAKHTLVERTTKRGLLFVCRAIVSI